MTSTDQRWYQQPVAWLGLLILAASLAGCISMIMLAAQHDDPPLANTTETSFKILATRAQPEATPAQEQAEQ
ncbi:MAG: hypothetical protein ABIY56_05765 [Dokdonella sp.]